MSLFRIAHNSLGRLSFRFAVKKFNLPDLGEKIKEGKIQKWYVKEGENVEEFQKLADITSDKQFTQLTASDTGQITKIFYGEGDNCLVGSALFEIDIKQEGSTQSTNQQTPKKHDAKSDQPKAASKTSAGTSPHTITDSATETKRQSNKLIATPAVRHLIKEHNIDISTVESTGKDGRVLKEDVVRYLDNKDNKAKSKPEKPPKAIESQKPSQIGTTEPRRTTVSMSPFERGMQKTMSLSNQVPHLSYHEEFNLTELMKMRESSKNLSKEKITYMSYFIKTFSMAISEFPIINSHYNPENPFEYSIVDNHNITIAIDTPNGLAVPNIKNVQNLSIIQVQTQLNRLRRASQVAKIDRKDLEGGTISMSNIGTVGGTYARPLILPPQVVIVALGKTRRLPRFQSQTSSNVVARNIMSVSFSADHRVIDGGTIANFSNKWKQYLETPALILLGLR